MPLPAGKGPRRAEGASRVRATPRTWRPVRSVGPALGAAITLIALGCTGVLFVADNATSSDATRVACAIGTLAGAATFVVCAVGTWWCSTLGYVLSPTALEVRAGSRLLRVRYDEIDGVVGRGDDEVSVPGLWPGAYIGRKARQVGGGAELWRGTTRDAGSAVVVSTAGAGYVVTPAEPTSFREELIDSARAATYVGSRVGTPERSWLDAASFTDGWVRALLFGAGVVATLGIALDVARLGASQRDGIAASTILLANAIAALGLSIRWPGLARLLAAGALASQIVALF